jgi:hypothetical protein
MKWKRFLIISGIGLVLALGFRFYLQHQAAQVPRGSTAVYAIDANGNARVEFSDRIYFSTPEVEQNFDSYLDRIGGRSADTEVLAKSMRDKADSLSKSLGRQMTVDGFAARVVKEAEFGGRLNEFNWQAFAALENATWRVAFPQTEQIMMNEHSSLTLILPAGASIVSAEPQPDTSAGGTLTWRGPRDMPWPIVEYQLP